MRTLWDSAKARQKALDEKPQFWAKKRPKNLFSFLLKCCCCGSGMSKVSTERYDCSSARNKGTCDNRLIIRQDNLKKYGLGFSAKHLMNPELVKVFAEEYTNHINELSKTRNARINYARKELKKLEADKDKLIKAITGGVPGAEVKEPMERIMVRREELEQVLDTTEEASVLLHPNMADRYQQEINALRESLNREATKSEAADLLRGLIDKIVLKPKPDTKKYAIDLHGDLAGILTAAAGKQQRVR